ncbi:MAG TPA: HAMP domain-containing sensor histidine kinase [Polyangiaceae bacterium]|nr:HAMP domain-containing sensor histidine kinase [Polyangiaceae bacterium]
MAVLVYGETGKISFSNPEACLLFAQGKPLDGENFLSLVPHAPEALRESLLHPTDTVFTVQAQAGLETFSLAKRTLDVTGEPHTLLMIKELTAELGRQEIEVWKKVIRLINHELNNSLAPILSMVRTARFIATQPEQLPKLAGVFETIEERARHLAAFLEGYARFARLPQPRPEPVVWAPFLDGMRALYPDAQIGEAPTREGYFDPGQLQQVVINLLKNAFEASPKGAASVELRVDVDGAGATTLSVADRGAGMTAEVMQSAVLPFFTTKETGSGLGLALAREIVEAHRGRLDISRRDGGGIEVKCWMPGRQTARDDLRSRARTTTLTLTHH